jgi:hypothetical protein
MGTGNMGRMRKVIDETFRNYYGADRLTRDDIDAYIILVNYEKRFGYTYAQGNLVDKDRRQQPVCPIIISAPTGQVINDHKLVATDAIAHELGHAIAKLMDEYLYTDEKGFENVARMFPYDIAYRNISDKPIKWQRLITLDSKYFNAKPVLPPGNDQKLVEFKHPKYIDTESVVPQEYYIPTINGTMRANERSIYYQFGPVCTYHMEGSFRTRLGLIPAQDPVYDGNTGYEWNGYSFENFMNDWKPYDFN